MGNCIITRSPSEFRYIGEVTTLGAQITLPSNWKECIVCNNLNLHDNSYTFHILREEVENLIAKSGSSVEFLAGTNKSVVRIKFYSINKVGTKESQWDGSNYYASTWVWAK